MAESFSLPTTSVTQVEEVSRSPVVKLKLKKPKSDKKVKWTEGTVDNEHMDKKKSKCCCIYEKPKVFGESSSEDEDDECKHCRGHKNKCYQSKPPDDPSPGPESMGT
ncbi:hypothetical protein CAPTEDRAFT_220139 [Capitella teleta]|uniref:E3 ubiquitin-protein ligase PPP1R11 n=1 Tax=Capitella teleta TaxID=283909 RepID=R7URX7_CAPTE|nr:hypothetical protein CAPTEDRAFT_220139 [Capitella teleta]|eukprot:ELU06662.1 hypothetical protein CAPTEDRAFT_220139 [Capitella teleta]